MAANGSAIHLAGELTLPVNFNGQRKLDVTFMVSEQVDEPMLGMDFFDSTGCELILAEGKISFGCEKIPIVRRAGANWRRSINASVEIVIPPRTQVNVPTRVNSGSQSIRKGSDWMIEHRELRPGVHLARALVNSSATELMVRVVNVSDETVTLRERPAW